jgi:arylsulfatase A-like enzyme
MNSLQKLVEANGYREWISRDTILEQLVPESAKSQDLDEHVGTMHYDLCKTLSELTGRLPPSRSAVDPVFVYTQAQNIHISVIDREGRSVPKGMTFPAEFNAAYSSRVQKMDNCLGKFLEDLKKNGMYDDSIIIVTSDHGDSLGERGRWGHAYTIFPEIVRIPLIIHLPTWMLASVKHDTQAAAFLTDLTPTLYYLLGQKPIVNNPILGRPLFTATHEEQAPYRRDSYLVASSYAPVYGLVSQNGRQLYIVDGVNYRDHAYELSPDGTSHDAPLSEEQRVAMQHAIREQVNAIARFYGLH